MRFAFLLTGRACLIAVLAALAVGPGGWRAAEAAGFLPHRAVYDLSLAKSRNNGAMARAEGKLEFEWADACTGWTVNQRTRVEMATSEGRSFEFGWSLSALESRDGRHYRFFIRRINSDGSDEAVRGEARFPTPGAHGLAVFNAPESRELRLAKGTLFPTAHSLILMEAAAKGELPLWRTVFDGSGEDGRFGVNAALIEALAADAPKRFDSPLLRDQASWRLRLAYFGMDETVSEPEHEQGLRLYANGVVDEMLLDYGDFVLRADLDLLEALPPLDCKAE
ncbi:MAG: EipB family protein [Alphaproteobacteria bacterium]